MMTHLRCRLLAVLLGAASLLFAAHPAAAVELQEQVKAAFLLNFAKFVEWPEGKFPQPASPVLLCVFGDAARAHDFQTVLSDRHLGQRPVVVTLRSTSQAGDCHIAFVSSKGTESVRQTLAELAGSGALTVYETEEFLEGGAIRFFIQDRKIRFEIDADAASREALKISSKLLRVASQRAR